MEKKQSKKVTKETPLKSHSTIAKTKGNVDAGSPEKRQRSKARPEHGTARKKRVKERRGIKKKYLGTDSSCRVTLSLPKEAVGTSGGVNVVGDFNNWDSEAMPMKRLRSGDFEITIELQSGREYRFRYLIDGSRWENDWSADNYYPNPYGCDDSVLIV